MKNLLSVRSVHFIGILGSSMSNLALFAKKMGYSVSGSDKTYSNKLSELTQNGIQAYVGANTDIAPRSELVVYSSAIPESDKELSVCRKNGVHCITRSEYLGMLSMLFERVIAVSGTHGKSTVTAMLGEIFIRSGLAPCVHLGGGYDFPSSFSFKYFITEACEYRESFLSLSPDIALILNIEPDHPDCFKSIEELNSAFLRFAERTKDSGAVIMGEGIDLEIDKRSIRLSRDTFCEDVSQNNGLFSFTPYIFGKKYPRVKLSVPGRHNVTNALFALLVADIENISPDISTNALTSFKGVDRRFQKVLHKNSAEIISDYAHHPTEIACSVKTAKLQSSHVTVLFQPHTYSRTAKLFDSFLTAFDEADSVIIVEEFPARETPDMGRSAKELADELAKRRECSYCTLSEAKSILDSVCTQEGIVLIMGAGNIDSIIS